MFFTRILPLMAYRLIIQSKSKGLGNAMGYTVSLITSLFLIHLAQILVLIFYDGTRFNRNSTSFYIWIIILYGLPYYCFSKIYTKNKLVHWWFIYKNKKFMKYPALIFWLYFFANFSLLIFLAVIKIKLK